MVSETGVVASGVRLRMGRCLVPTPLSVGPDLGIQPQEAPGNPWVKLELAEMMNTR